MLDSGGAREGGCYGATAVHHTLIRKVGEKMKHQLIMRPRDIIKPLESAGHSPTYCNFHT